MGKTIGRILKIGLAVGVAFVPGVGQAIGMAVFQGAIGIGAGVGIAAGLANAVIGGIVVSGLSSLGGVLGLGPSSPKPETTLQAIKTPRPPRVSAYGVNRLFGAYGLYETATDGTAVDMFAVHDGQLDTVLGFYLGDDPVTLTGNTVNAGADGRYKDGVAKLYYTTGLTPGAGLPAISAKIPEWSGRGDGVVLLGALFSPIKSKHFLEAYPNGIPQASMVARWQRCPDAYAADPTNPAGWTWTENPIRQLMHYKLVREGVDYATKIAPTIAYWRAAQDVCDQPRALKAGGTEPRYRSWVSHKHTDSHGSVTASILETCDGWIAPRSDGALVVYAGQYQAPDVTIGPDEIVSFEWSGVGVDDDEAVNELICAYISADHDYNTVETDAWRDEADISTRGQVLSDNFEPQVPSWGQVRALAKRHMARKNAIYRGSVTTNIAGRKARGKRYINLDLTDAGTTFYSGPAEIVAVTRNISTGGITFEWVAADPNIDNWNPATEEGDPAAKGDRVAPVPITAPTITGVTVIDGPRLQLTVTGPDRGDLTWFGHTRVAGATVWGTDLEYSETGSGASVTLVTDIVPAGQTVEVQVAYQTGDGRMSPWSATSSTVSTPAPSVRAGGTAVSGAADIVPTLPDGVQQNDILLLVVETANQPVAIPSGWTQVPNSPQGIGTAGVGSATAIQAFWRRATNSETAPTVSGTTDHKSARIYAIRNAATTGTPFEATAGNTLGSASTAVTIPSVTTLGDNRLILMFASREDDHASTVGITGWTNANLADIVMLGGAGTTIGNGGGFTGAAGVKATAGATGTTTATAQTATNQARLIIAFRP